MIIFVITGCLVLTITVNNPEFDNMNDKKVTSRHPENIQKRIVRAIYKYKLLEDKDKVLVGVSGGKDSLILLETWLKRENSCPLSLSFWLLI